MTEMTKDFKYSREIVHDLSATNLKAVYKSLTNVVSLLKSHSADLEFADRMDIFSLSVDVLQRKDITDKNKMMFLEPLFLIGIFILTACNGEMAKAVPENLQTFTEEALKCSVLSKNRPQQLSRLAYFAIGTAVLEYIGDEKNKKDKNKPPPPEIKAEDLKFQKSSILSENDKDLLSRTFTHKSFANELFKEQKALCSGMVLMMISTTYMESYLNTFTVYIIVILVFSYFHSFWAKKDNAIRKSIVEVAQQYSLIAAIDLPEITSSKKSTKKSKKSSKKEEAKEEGSGKEDSDDFSLPEGSNEAFDCISKLNDIVQNSDDLVSEETKQYVKQANQDALDLKKKKNA